MKKLVLALAAVASLGASVASAGTLTVHNDAVYTVTLQPHGKNYNGTETTGDTIELFPGQSHTFTYDPYGWQKVKYNILFSGNGDQFRHITALDHSDHLYFHGPLWNPWISTSTDGV